MPRPRRQVEASTARAPGRHARRTQAPSRGADIQRPAPQTRLTTRPLSCATLASVPTPAEQLVSRAKTIDYAAVSSVFAGALAAHASAAHRRRRAPAETALDVGQFALATFAVADAIAHERIAHWIRRPFVEDTPDDHGGRAKGEGMRYVIGELLGCSRCVGSWSALGLAALTSASPAAGKAVIGVFAAAGANDLIQAAFKVTTTSADHLADAN